MSNQGESAIFHYHSPISATDMTTGVMTSKGQSCEVTGRVFYRNHRLYPLPPLMSPGPGLCRVTMVRRYDESCLSQTRRLF